MKIKTRIKWLFKKLNSKRKETYDTICYDRCLNWIKNLKEYVRYNLPVGIEYIEDYYDDIVTDLLYSQLSLRRFSKSTHKNMLMYFSSTIKGIKNDINVIKNVIEVEFPLSRASCPIDVTTTKFVYVYNAFKKSYIGYITGKIGINTNRYVGILMDDATGDISDITTIDDTYLVKPLYDDVQISRFINQYSSNLIKQNKFFNDVMAQNKILSEDWEKQQTYYKTFIEPQV